MASDPFPPHHAVDDLEASTAITSVTSEAIDHAAKHAADLVESVAHMSQKTAGGRRTGRKAAGEPPVPAEASARDTVFEAAAAGEAEQSRETGEPASSDGNATSGQTRIVTNEAAAGGEADGATSLETLARFNARAAEAVRANVDATFAFLASMMGVRSVSEAVSLNAEHMREQMARLTAQTRDLSGLAQQLAVESLERFRGSSGRAK